MSKKIKTFCPSNRTHCSISPQLSNCSSQKSGSTSIFCRICHDGENPNSPRGHPLVAPCKCTGSVALIHLSCLEHWLTASNTDQCELCKFQTIREPRSCAEYFREPENQFNVRNLIADIICFFLLTPLLLISTYLCGLGASQYFIKERWEAIGLVVLSLVLLAVYFTWCHVTTRYHISSWRSWQRTHQTVRLLQLNSNDALLANHSPSSEINSSPSSGGTDTDSTDNNSSSADTRSLRPLLEPQRINNADTCVDFEEEIYTPPPHNGKQLVSIISQGARLTKEPREIGENNTVITLESSNLTLTAENQYGCEHCHCHVNEGFIPDDNNTM